MPLRALRVRSSAPLAPVRLALVALTLATLLFAGWRAAPSVEAQGGVTLQPRWNLVTAPRAGSGQQLVGNLARVQSAHHWNAATREFESWRRGAPDFLQTLENADSGAGLWIEVTGEVPWDLPPLGDNLPIDNADGFRLVGWVENDTTPADALLRLRGERIVGWDETRQAFDSFDPDLPPLLNGLGRVERGRAYWVAFSLGALPPVALELIATANNPVDIVPLSGGELLVVQQNGLVQRLQTATGTLGTFLLDLRDRVGSGGERGLLSIALDPGFSSNGLIYAYYWVAGQDRMRLSRFTTFNNSFIQGSELILLQIDQPFGNHNGGRLVFGPDGFLYLSIGDGGSQNDPMGHGQNLATLLGTVIRIDVAGASGQTAYRIPDDNPFVGQGPGVRPEIFAYGFRNPWRMAFDRETGQLWLADVGQNTVEEIDIVTSGGNYGWDFFEGPDCFESPTCQTSGFTPPVAFYRHDEGCSISGGAVYRGRDYPALQGAYVFADFCNGAIWGTWAANPGQKETLNAGVDNPVSIAEDARGELYVVAQGGGIYQIVEP